MKGRHHERGKRRTAWSALLPGMAILLAMPVHAAGSLPASPPEGREQAETCLAQAISFEAGTEPEQGREAVAEVVLNRLRDPRYPKTVCGVVFQGAERRTGCQFTFACDGSLARRRPADWDGALRIARAALDGGLPSAVGGATHYHAFYVQPAWAAQLTRVARIGAHIFYAPAAGAGPARMASAVVAPPPPPAAFSAWGLQTAVLVVRHGRVQVEPGPTPPPAPGMADRGSP